MKFVESEPVKKKFHELEDDDVCRIEYGDYGNYLLIVLDKEESYKDPRCEYEWHDTWVNLDDYLNNNHDIHVGYQDIYKADEPEYEVVGKVVNE